MYIFTTLMTVKIDLKYLTSDCN